MKKKNHLVTLTLVLLKYILDLRIPIKEISERVTVRINCLLINSFANIVHVRSAKIERTNSVNSKIYVVLTKLALPAKWPSIFLRTLRKSILSTTAIRLAFQNGPVLFP